MKKLSPGISTRGTETGSIEDADKQLTENSKERTALLGVNSAYNQLRLRYSLLKVPTGFANAAFSAW